MQQPCLWLIPVAELHSVLDGRDEVESENGVLCGTISGLDREHPHTGLLFERLAARVQGIFDYPAEAFAKQYQALAPDGAYFITVDALERTLGISPGIGSPSLHVSRLHASQIAQSPHLTYNTLRPSPTHSAKEHLAGFFYVAGRGGRKIED